MKDLDELNQLEYAISEVLEWNLFNVSCPDCKYCGSSCSEHSLDDACVWSIGDELLEDIVNKLVKEIGRIIE